jgi:hypothetical protein
MMNPVRLPVIRRFSVKPYTPTRREEDLIKLINDRYYYAAEARKKYEKKWERFYKLYRSQPETKKKGKANIFVPQIFTTVEAIVPRLVSGYLSTSKPPVDVVGATPRDHYFSQYVKTLKTWQYNKMRFPVFLDMFTRQTLIYGTGIAKVYWKFSKNFDGPFVECIDLFDFFIDPDALSISDAKYVIQRKMMDKDTLMACQERGIYKNVEYLTQGSGTQYKQNPENEKKGKEGAPDDDDKEFELLEYWEEDKLITLGNNRVLLRERDNPFDHKKKPFVATKFIPSLHEFYGIGVIEPLEGPQNELNTKRNQRLDNINLMLNMMWMLQSGAIDDLKQLVARPGGIIVCNDINGLKPVPVHDYTSKAMQEEQVSKNDIHETSGVNEFVRGTNTDGSSLTATEIRVKYEQSATRLDYNLKLMAETGIRDIATMIVALDQQFITDEQIVRVVSDGSTKFYGIRPEDIRGDFEVKVNPDPAGIGERERLENLTNAFMMVQNMQSANPVPLAKAIFEQLNIPAKVISEVFPDVVPEEGAMIPHLPEGLPGQYSVQGEIEQMPYLDNRF